MIPTFFGNSVALSPHRGRLDLYGHYSQNLILPFRSSLSFGLKMIFILRIPMSIYSRCLMWSLTIDYRCLWSFGLNCWSCKIYAELRVCQCLRLRQGQEQKSPSSCTIEESWSIPGNGTGRCRWIRVTIRRSSKVLHAKGHLKDGWLRLGLCGCWENAFGK